MVLAATTGITLFQVGSLLAAGLAALVGLSVYRSNQKERAFERETIAANASKVAVEVFQLSVKQLKDDLAEAIAETGKLRRELKSARLEVADLIKAKTNLETEIIYLRSRTQFLEREVESLKNNGTTTKEH